MELISNGDYQVVAKEVIEYVDKKTGELKQLYKIYANSLKTGIQEQIILNQKAYNKVEKNAKVQLMYEKTQNGCYLKDFINK